MEQKKKSLVQWRATRMERRFVTAIITAVSAEFFINLWTDNFRLSASVVLFPVLLLTLMRDCTEPGTGVVTGLMVLLVRSIVGMMSGVEFSYTVEMEYSGALFYICYDILLCIQIPDRNRARLSKLWYQLFFCDVCSNLLDLTLSRWSIPDLDEMVTLVLVGVLRSAIAVLILWGVGYYKRLLLAEEHERRYQRLFLMTANLKNELYFLKKDAENIEGIMSRAYRLYEQLRERSAPEEMCQLALSIARDVHEVKKDNLSIIRGIEGEVMNAYNDEKMRMSDLFHILADTIYHIFHEQSGRIVLEYDCQADFTTSEHYRLMSILKNLVMNAAEAILGETGTGTIWVSEEIIGDQLKLTVQDNGPGISPRAMRKLFSVGYSTKFDPETGNINRGIGLPAVEFMVQEMGGSIRVVPNNETARNCKGACFEVMIPVQSLGKGDI